MGESMKEEYSVEFFEGQHREAIHTLAKHQHKKVVLLNCLESENDEENIKFYRDKLELINDLIKKQQDEVALTRKLWRKSQEISGTA